MMIVISIFCVNTKIVTFSAHIHVITCKFLQGTFYTQCAGMYTVYLRDTLYVPISNGPLSSGKLNLKQKIALPPYFYFTFCNYIYLIKVLHFSTIYQPTECGLQAVSITPQKIACPAHCY